MYPSIPAMPIPPPVELAISGKKMAMSPPRERRTVLKPHPGQTNSINVNAKYKKKFYNKNKNAFNATLYKFSTLTSAHLARPMIILMSTFENIVFT
jgi:hypothetical protein